MVGHEKGGFLEINFTERGQYMKRIMVLAVALVVAVGFCVVANADDEITVKEKTTVREGKVKTVVKAKDESTGTKAEMKQRTTKSGTTTKEVVKGDAGKMKITEKETSKGIAGKAKVKIKKGALKKMSVDYEYYQMGTEYVIEYNVKDKGDKDLVEKLGLTPEQAATIEPGHHKIVSTSPYTAQDVDNDFMSVIITDLRQAANKK